MKERIKISFSSPGSDEREIEITLVEGQKKVAIECVGDFEPVSCENAIFKHIHGGQYALTANSHRFVLKIQRKMGDTR
ncbi:MAG: hypothetical protein E4H13_12155 [Calditrichales bacterium]|nr:MAG: hypothetical protein E4H13_12155 [Calditrichales bacterium]